jgi:uncharacterized protein with NRDE domain
MCLIFFAINNHPTYKLILAGNRDEFYSRKTTAATFWNDHPEIIGGRDLEANGMWLGMTRQGRISFITNYRDIQNIKHGAPSRGLLVSDYLENSSTPDAYLQSIRPQAEIYNGFNLIVGDVNGLWYLSNYQKGFAKIADGFHGLSNHLLETPWPKIVRGKEMLRPILARPSIDINDLMEALRDTTRAEDDKLPDTGIGLERERVLSSMFIKSPGYGSRCSTVILVDRANKVTFSERTYNLETFQFTTETFEFKLSLPLR